ncbi:MAG: hypothetical protein WAM53_02935 [Terrimicrobiaceae bacterium]
MSRCCSNCSIGKSLFYLVLLLLCVSAVVAWPDIKRYLRMSKM